MSDYLPDRELAASLNPLLMEMESRMVARGDGGRASQIARLRTYVVAEFGVEKDLKARDVKTQPLFANEATGRTKQ